MRDEYEGAVRAMGESSAERKLFSVEEANRAIPYIKKIFSDLVDVNAEVNEIDEELEYMDDGLDRVETQRDLDLAEARLKELSDEIFKVGVASVALGSDGQGPSVGFPAQKGNEEIVLVWKAGEKAITGWYSLHEMDIEDVLPINCLDM